ncbi:sororin isoform X3 [Tamandua tetradactyla]|uniref:sororin isoform X3 n=1 Tax=Tamandua tetradactyla TaxID=48850 RepID=UPI00405468A4
MSGRQTRSGGAAPRSGPKAPSPTNLLRRSQRKSGSDLPSTLPEIWPKVSTGAAVRKPIVLKKIVAHAQEIPAVHSPRRSPRIAFFLEKENNPPIKEPTKEDLFKTSSVPVTPAATPVLNSLNVESNSTAGPPDARDLEMSKKVRRSYSRLEALGSASTSTPGRRSCFGFERLLGAENLAGVSPVVCSKSAEAPTAPVKPWTPDTALPGISPLTTKEKRKKRKVPEILSSQGTGRAFSEPMAELGLQHSKEQKPETQQASLEPRAELPSMGREGGVAPCWPQATAATAAPSLPKPPSWKQELDPNSEPTVTFLFTLLNTPEPAEPDDSEEDMEIQECPFLDKDDWGPQRTVKEIRHLKKDCMRLWESLNITRMENLVLGKKLQNLPNSLYKSLKQKEAKAIQEGDQQVQEGAQDVQGGVPVVQEDVQRGVPVVQEETQAFQKAALLQQP